MGFFDRFKKGKINEVESLKNNRVWGESFLDINDIYQIFASFPLESEDVLTFVINNDDPDVPDAISGGEYCLEDNKSTYPAIHISGLYSNQVMRYGDFLQFLNDIGDSHDWNYVCQFVFDYQAGRFNHVFLSVPFNPIIECEANDPRRVHFSAERWYNGGGSTGTHMGWGAAAL